MQRSMILIIDFGGQDSQNIARKIRAERVYCEVVPYSITPAAVAQKAPLGLVFAGGGQADAAAADALRCDASLWATGLPTLGIGYGARAMVQALGGKLEGALIQKKLESVAFSQHKLFNGVGEGTRSILRADALTLPAGHSALAQAGDAVMAFGSEQQGMYGLQFVPEQNDQDGNRVLRNFVVDICGCQPNWTMRQFIAEQVDAIRAAVGEGQALLAMSGGVDSSVCAALMHRAIGRQLHCIYVDTGLMRKSESDEVERAFRDSLGINLTRVDASARFFARLKGITDPEKKRMAVGEEFIRVFEEEARKIGKVDFLVQGTIYPDVIESGVGAPNVKKHHNVGGLPDVIDFKAIIEPVRELFKDEVRMVGEELQLPASIVWRQPFPGPGLSVRCLGEVTPERIATLRDADAIFRAEVAAAGLDRQIWQYFVVLTNLQSTGVRNGARSYEHTVALRAVHSIDAMTASVARLPYDLLERVVRRITSEVPGVSRVVYDITPKGPATIEWE